MKRQKDFKTREEYLDYLTPIAEKNGIPRKRLLIRVRDGMDPHLAVVRPISSKPDMDHPYKRPTFNATTARKANANR
jgi:hypothetical protein